MRHIDATASRCGQAVTGGRCAVKYGAGGFSGQDLGKRSMGRGLTSFDEV
ncbi:hypothetical protein GCM10027404_32690 [Arthrobacter tumbae]|nr:hypothetical protein [Arthrobacter tumbae]MBM7781241.1 hypothetical protein [Arthrobacter tumbae]